MYCSNVNRIDEEASTTITTMGYMYVSPSGQYLGTKSMQDDGSESIVPHIYALANDYSDSVALVANLLFGLIPIIVTIHMIFQLINFSTITTF